MSGRDDDGIREAAAVTGCRNMTIVTHEEEETVQDEQGTIRIVPAWKWCREDDCGLRPK